MEWRLEGAEGLRHTFIACITDSGLSSEEYSLIQRQRRLSPFYQLSDDWGRVDRGGVCDLEYNAAARGLAHSFEKTRRHRASGALERPIRRPSILRRVTELKFDRLVFA
jgi:hypothetical protein